MTYQEAGELMGIMVRETLKPYSWLAPVFHVATLVLMVLLWRFKKKIGRYFYAYLAGNYVFMAFAQNVAIIEKFGFVIISSNLLQILFVAVLWVRAFFQYDNDFATTEVEKWRFWAIPFMILAFWSPMNELGQPDFNPLLFLTSGYGLAFCFTTPVMIFILTLYYPQIYRPAYRFLCIVGIYFGVLNLIGPLIIPGYPVWVAFLHVPLFIISISGLMLEKVKH